MNRLTAPAETSITSIAITIAVTMIESSLAMPTAVITESSENTMSSSRICDEHPRRTRRARRGAARLVGLRLDLLVDLPGGLADQEEAAAQQDEVAPRDAAAEHGHEGLGEAHHPRDREEQADADAEGQDEPEPPRDLAPALGQAAPPGSR